MQIKTFLEKIGAVEIQDNLSLQTLREHKASLFEKKEDFDKCLKSTSLFLYPGLVENGLGVAYLGYRVPLWARRIIAQIRLVNKYNNRIVTKNGKITFSDLEYCELCIKTNSLAHRLTDCSYHKEVREKYLGNLFDSELI